MDDSLDVFALHSGGGIIGTLMTGVFAADYIAHLDGITVIEGGCINGHWIQLAYQLADATAGFAWSFVVSYFILMCIKLMGHYIPALKLRVNVEQEEQGIDDVEIGEFAYDFVEEAREVKSIYEEKTDTISKRYSQSLASITGKSMDHSDTELLVYPREMQRTSFDHMSLRTP